MHAIGALARRVVGVAGIGVADAIAKGDAPGPAIHLGGRGNRLRKASSGSQNRGDVLIVLCFDPLHYRLDFCSHQVIQRRNLHDLILRPAGLTDPAVINASEKRNFHRFLRGGYEERERVDLILEEVGFTKEWKGRNDVSAI